MVRGVQLAMPLLLVLAFLVAGCAGQADETGSTVKLGDGSTLHLQEAPAPSTGKGAISGVVVDEAIRPIAAATVQVTGIATAVLSDETGLFVVADLDPGLYTLEATAPGYLPIQTTAEVRAGETAKVRIVLAIDSTPRPYHVVLQHDGFIQVGNGAFNQVYQLFVRDVVPLDSCTCQFYFQTEAQASTFIIEVMWEQTVPGYPLGTDGYYALWDDGGGDYVDNGCDNPCYGRVEWAEFALDETRDFHTDFWMDYYWVQYNQEFKQYVTVFYNGAAPEGWSFLNGDT